MRTTKLNERGITLQTTIITSILSLAAVSVGIIIYNLIKNETQKLDNINIVLENFYSNERENNIPAEDPVKTPKYIQNIIAINAGNRSTCGIDSRGTTEIITDDIVVCWGSNSNKQLGVLSTDNQPFPFKAKLTDDSLLKGITQLDGGVSFNCGLQTNGLESGIPYCWGENFGLGRGDDIESKLAEAVLISEGEELTDISQISANGNHTCALKVTDKTIWCWGVANHYRIGPSGDAEETNRVVTYATKVTNLDGSDLTNIEKVSVGHRHTCVIKTDSTVWCWGWNGKSANKGSGQIGIGARVFEGDDPRVGGGTTNASVRFPVRVGTRCPSSSSFIDSIDDCKPSNEGFIQSTFDGVKDITTGFWSTCGLVSNSVYCWVDIDFGLLDEYDEVQDEPVLIMSNVSSISVSHKAFCALKIDKTVWCWGNNFYGQLGNAVEIGNKSRPVQIVDKDNNPLSNIKELSVGDTHSCVLTENDLVLCWGSNEFNELGTGNINGDDLGCGTSVYPVNSLSYFDSSYFLC